MRKEKNCKTKRGKDLVEEKIWERKYRPTTLDDYVFSSEKTKEYITKLIDEKEIPHLLISGIQGTGKSTIAQILINNFVTNKSDVLHVKASSRDRKLDNVVERVENFCQTFPMGECKVVLFEEADGLSVPAQKALRETIDDYGDVVRFIFTANYVNKIIPALHSRVQQIHIEQLDDDEILERVAYIIENENIDVLNADFVYNHIDRFKPDMRKIINSIQQSSSNGVLGDVIDVVDSDGEFIDQWEVEWKSDEPTFERLYDLAIGADQHNFEQAYTFMYENVDKLDDEYKAVRVIAEYLYRAQAVANQEILLKACLIEMFGVLEE